MYGPSISSEQEDIWHSDKLWVLRRVFFFFKAPAWSKFDDAALLLHMDLEISVCLNAKLNIGLKEMVPCVLNKK